MILYVVIQETFHINSMEKDIIGIYKSNVEANLKLNTLKDCYIESHELENNPTELETIYKKACEQLQAECLADEPYRTTSKRLGLNIRQVWRICEWEQGMNFPVKIEQIIKSLSMLE